MGDGGGVGDKSKSMTVHRAYCIFKYPTPTQPNRSHMFDIGLQISALSQLFGLIGEIYSNQPMSFNPCWGFNVTLQLGSLTKYTVSYDFRNVEGCVQGTGGAVDNLKYHFLKSICSMVPRGRMGGVVHLLIL